jgi:DNA (cytosine-5)-methyltransferase 1
LKDDTARIFNEDIDIFLKRSMSGELPGYYPGKGDVDHIHSSSPCQGFSDANRNGGRNDVQNNRLSYRWVSAMRQHRPPTGSFENVVGMLNKGERIRENEPDQDDEQDEKNNREYIQKMVDDLLILGYQVRVCILTSSDYGDPQERSRVFLFAALKGWKLPDIPKSTKICPFREALGDLVDIDPVEGNGIVKLPTGAIVHDHSIYGTKLKKENDHLSQVQGDFARTVRRQRGIKHHVHPRGLTVRERARIQSFPDDYQFAGSMRDKLNQIGNAVPVKLATAVAQSIMESHKFEFK